MAMAAVVARATGSAGTAFETLARSSTAAVLRATAAAVRATTTVIGASAVAAIVAAAIAATTAERALETLARITADARGVSREFFARSGSAGNPRSASFAGEQDDVILGNGGYVGGGNHVVGGNFRGIGAFGFFLAVGAFGVTTGVVLVFIFMQA
jgi:hypothetical protein